MYLEAVELDLRRCSDQLAFLTLRWGDGGSRQISIHSLQALENYGQDMLGEGWFTWAGEKDNGAQDDDGDEVEQAWAVVFINEGRKHQDLKAVGHGHEGFGECVVQAGWLSVDAGSPKPARSVDCTGRFSGMSGVHMLSSILWFVTRTKCSCALTHVQAARRHRDLLRLLQRGNCGQRRCNKTSCRMLDGMCDGFGR